MKQVFFLENGKKISFSCTESKNVMVVNIRGIKKHRCLLNIADKIDCRTGVRVEEVKLLEDSAIMFIKVESDTEKCEKIAEGKGAIVMDVISEWLLDYGETKKITSLTE